jgi:hypothetical protein
MKKEKKRNRNKGKSGRSAKEKVGIEEKEDE